MKLIVAVNRTVLRGLDILATFLTITSKVQNLILLSTVIKNDQSDNMREGLIDPVYAGSVMWLKEQLRRSHTFPGTKSRRL